MHPCVARETRVRSWATPLATPRRAFGALWLGAPRAQFRRVAGPTSGVIGRAAREETLPKFVVHTEGSAAAGCRCYVGVFHVELAQHTTTLRATQCCAALAWTPLGLAYASCGRVSARTVSREIWTLQAVRRAHRTDGAGP
ncbi:hypothetical protein GCM10009793_21220 [Brachybacterium phenoliresistens]